MAQEPSGVDLHGEVAPLPTGLPGQPLTTLGAPMGIRGAWGVSALGEFANDPATLVVVDTPGGQAAPRPLVDGFAMAHLGGWVAPSRRWRVGGALPVYFTAANYTSERPTVGDLYLRSTLGLVLPDEADLTGPALGLTPSVTLPTGNGARLVGGEWSGQLSAVGGLRGEWLAAHGHLGLRLRESATLVSQQVGGVQVPLGAAAAIRVAEPLWLQAELRGNGDPGTTPEPTAAGLDVPALAAAVEGMVSLTSRFGQAWVGGSLGTALSSGVGAARSRGFAGVGYSHLPLPTPDVVVPVMTLEVVDPDGLPAEGARLLAGDTVLARADADGRMVFEVPEAWLPDTEVVLSGYERLPLSERPMPDETGEPPILELTVAPTVIDARVTDRDGVVVPATLTATPIDGGRERSGAPGELALGPGTWEVAIAAPGLAPQRRTVVVSQDASTAPFDAVLAPPEGDEELVLAVVDHANRAVPDAVVLVDGVPVGTVAEGALVGVGGMAGDDVRVEVQHPAYTAAVVDVTPGTPRTVHLTRVPGTVRVTAVGPQSGPVTDAVVRFLGPSRLEPAPLGERGERLQVLSPGRWDVVVSSPSYGVQRRVIEVAEDQYELLDVVVQLQVDEGGDCELGVSVVDPEGQPVRGVQVLLDDRGYGETSTGGTVTIDGLDVGARELWVLGDLLRKVPARPVDLMSGRVEEVVEVQWVEGAVQVRVSGPDGPVDDAVVRLLVDGQPPRMLALDADGVARDAVAPGQWTVLVSSPSYGLQQRRFTVAPDSDVLHRVDVVLTPPEGGLADLAVHLVDPDGLPVSGADVSLDGIDLGRTSSGGDLRLDELAVGDRLLEVDSELHLPWRRDLQLMEGEQVVEASLDWAPGVVRATVRSQDGPVTGAIVRWLGPQALSPLPVDEAGQVTTKLPPGTWQLLVSSPSYGVGQRMVEVPEASSDRIDVQLELSPAGEGVADLALQVVDPAGQGIEGASVHADGVQVGRTGPGGLWLGEDLAPGTRVVEVEHPAYGERSLRVVLEPGAQRRTLELPWREQAVPITVVDPAGRPVAGATLAVLGPVDRPEVTTDADGRATIDLVPGRWQLIVAGEGELGPARATVEVGAEPVEPQTLALGQAELEVSDEAIALRRQVLFDFDAADLAGAAGPVLDQVASALLGGAVLRVEVQGHTDNVGGAAYNQALSEARARAVREALVDRGVPPETLVARGYGPQRPVAPNDTEAGRAANRRVAFVITERADRGEEAAGRGADGG